MKKLIIMLMMICFLSFSYAEESEEMIMVELTDGTYETRPVSQYVSNEIGLKMLSVMSDAEKAVINATFDTEIIRAATIVPLKMEVTGQTSTYDSWRFSYVHANDILSNLETDIAGSPVRVAVIDSGINTNLLGEIDIVSGKNFSGGLETDYDDGYGHGSHVAGIIGAKLSGDDIDGIAPGIDIVPIKVFSDTGFGTTETLIAGLEYAISDEAGVDVINMSLSYGGTNSIIENLIALAEDKGIVVVAATANSSNLWLNTSDYNNMNIENNGPTQTFNIVTYPAAFETVLAVGSVTKHSTENKVGISDFSNVSGERDGINTVVDVVAPGQGIVSWNELDDTTEIMSGTSMATPHVAALAALIKNEYPDLTAPQIRTLIRETAYNPGIEFPTGIKKADETDLTESEIVGQGLMDVYKAYHFSPVLEMTLSDTDFTFDYETLEYNLTVPYQTPSIDMSGTVLSGSTLLLDGEVIDNLNQNITIDSDVTTKTLIATFGIYSKTYRITITRDLPILDTATFSDIDGEISTTFDKTILNQNILFDATVDDVTMDLLSLNAIIKIDGAVTSTKPFDISAGAVTTVIEVISDDDDSIKSIYTLRLEKDNDTVSLSDITFMGGPITDFDQSIISYDLGTVSYDEVLTASSSKITDSSTVAYSVNGEIYESSADFSGIHLSIPEETSTIDIKVTNIGDSYKIYHLTFVRDDGVDLDALDITPMINTTEQTTTEYTDLSAISQDVLYTENKVKLLPTIEDGGGRISYKIGSSEFTTTNTLELELGINNIVIRVENGILGEADYTTRDYNLTINRPGSADVSGINLTAYSDDTTVIPLYTSYAYDSETTNYTLEISDVLDHLKFDVSPVEATSISSVKVDSNTTQTFDATVNITLSPGDHVVVVKNEFGTSGQSDYLIKTYTYYIKVVSGTELSSIYLKADDTDLLTFDPENTTYNLVALTATTQLKFKAVKANTTYGEMKLTVDGATTDPVTIDSYIDGSEQLIDFDVPAVITLVIESPIASENKTYTFNITERAISSDSTLSGLSVSGYFISPTFNSGTLSYNLSVSNSVTSVTVQGIKNSSYASMTPVNAFNVSLGVGNNTIPVIVTAEDSSQTTYTVIINRAAVEDSGSSGGDSTPSSGGSAPPPPPPSGTQVPETSTIPEDEVVVIIDEDGTEKSVVTVSEERALADIEDDTVDKLTVVVTSEEAAEVALTLDILEAVTESNKPLEITYNDVTFKMTPEIIGGLNVEGTLNIVFETIVPTANDQKVVSDIYELDIMDGTKKLNFEILIPITLIYDQNQIGNAKNLAIYYYSEETKSWVYVGGKLGDNNEISFEARHFTKYAIRENNKTFEDIQTHWAKAAIETLASREITSGISETEFAPDKTLTNAEFVVLLTKVLGLADYDGPMNYSHVNPGDWYEPFFRRAHGAGLLINTFGVQMDPNTPIKREEMASLLMDAYFYYSRTNSEDQLINAVEFAFDEDQVSHHFRQDVRLAYQLQLIVGDNNNLFNPQNGATRAEAAIVIKKLLILLELL